MAGLAGMTLLSSCGSTRFLSGRLSDNGILIALDDFRKKDKTNAYHSYLVIRNEALQYPICVYRFTEDNYTALWMQCTHQGTELQVAGDALQCPAHGSEFDRTGKVAAGPANRNLRSFPVSVQGNELFIDLRKS